VAVLVVPVVIVGWRVGWAAHHPQHADPQVQPWSHPAPAPGFRDVSVNFDLEIDHGSTRTVPLSWDDNGRCGAGGARTHDL